MNFQTPGALQQTSMYDPTGGFRAGQSLMGTFSLPGAGGQPGPAPGPGAAPGSPNVPGAAPALPVPGQPGGGGSQIQAGVPGPAPNVGTPGVMGPAFNGALPQNPVLSNTQPGALTTMQPAGQPRPSDAQIRDFYLANASNPSAIFSAMQEYGVSLADIQRALGAANPANVAAMANAGQPAQGALPGPNDIYAPQLPIVNRTPQQLDTSRFDPANPFYDPYSIAGHPSTDQLLAAQRQAALLTNQQQYGDAMNNIDAAYEAKKMAAVDSANTGLRSQMQASHGLRDAELNRVANLLRSRGFSDGQMQQFLNQINEQYNQQLASSGGYLNSFRYAAPDWFDSMTP